MRAKYEFTRLLVTNFRECYLFYRDVLGFSPGLGTENDTYADFPMDGVSISLFDKAEMSQAVGTHQLPSAGPVKDAVCLVFAVTDVDAACTELAAKGIRLEVYPTDHEDWGIRTAHFRDPDGHLLEINQPLAR